MHALRVNDAKITTECAFNQGKQGTENNHECNKKEKTLCWVVLETRELSLRPQNTYIYVF